MEQGIGRASLGSTPIKLFAIFLFGKLVVANTDAAVLLNR